MIKEPRYRVKQLEYCNKQMFGNLIVTCPTYANRQQRRLIQPVPITVKPVAASEEIIRRHLMMDAEKRKTSLLVDQLLMDIHSTIQHSTDYNSTTSGRSSQQKYTKAQSHDLFKRDPDDLAALVVLLSGQIERVGVKLVRRLKRREALRRQQEAHCDVITCQLKKLLSNSTEDMCFTVDPQHGESGFIQWVAAMKMVAQLPGGIPPEFRKRLWLTMAEKHLASKGVDWSRVERTCFSEWSHPDDGELGVQIVKDLHRTGCSLFCGEGGQENQALLKKVLLAYARWNKAVGYCQGFNMLAALILQVTDKSETDALKLMIYLIEGVLPESYFADSLRGLSVDMAVFRELLRTRLPKLSKHLDLLQNMAKEGTTSYEPPLTNVFTMQWFLTLFCNCLPQPSVLRVWDLILLEGNEILLRTALAIWQALADRILRVRTADEFYCIMGVLTNELLENNLVDANSLIKAVVTIGPLTELKSLREHYLYNINPWGGMPSPLELAERQLKMYPKERLALDISTLKKQYLKLRQRQRQAHIIFTAAISKQPPTRAPVAMNHLLLGKSALVPAKRIGPPKGSIPPARVPTTLQWKDAKQTSSSSSSDTELCDEENQQSDASDDTPQTSPCEELPEDNPLQSDNSNLLRNNTIVETSNDGNIASEKNSNSDSIKSLVKTNSEKLKEKNVDIDSEDDSVDFELFLADRVKSLKQDDVLTEEERVGLSRRNSERALQIIQENSLILHRILQCQSRLSPPMIETGLETDDEVFSKKSSDSCRHDGDGMFSPPGSTSEIMASYSKNCYTSENDAVAEEFQDLSLVSLQKTSNDSISIENVSEYRSKYSEILEKSRNLDEKYNDLILRSNKKAFDNDAFLNNEYIELSDTNTFTSQNELIDFESDIPSDANTFEMEDFENVECNSLHIFHSNNPGQNTTNFKSEMKLIDTSENKYEVKTESLSDILDSFPRNMYDHNTITGEGEVICYTHSDTNFKSEHAQNEEKQEIAANFFPDDTFISEDISKENDENNSYKSKFDFDYSSKNISDNKRPIITEILSNTKIMDNYILNIDVQGPMKERFESTNNIFSNSNVNQQSGEEILAEDEKTEHISSNFYLPINISVIAPSAVIDTSSSDQSKDLLDDQNFVSPKIEFSESLKTPSESTSSTLSYNLRKDVSADTIHRKCLSATNSIEKSENFGHRRSLSATNSIERNISPGRNILGRILEPKKELLFQLTRADSMESNSEVWSPTRSRLSSSSSREVKSPISEKSTTSSRLNSPSPDRGSGLFRRYSPNYMEEKKKDDRDRITRSSVSSIEDVETDRVDSPKKGTILGEGSPASQYTNYNGENSACYDSSRKKETSYAQKSLVSHRTISPPNYSDFHSSRKVYSDFTLNSSSAKNIKTVDSSASREFARSTYNREMCTSNYSSKETTEATEATSIEDDSTFVKPAFVEKFPNSISKSSIPTKDKEYDLCSSRSALSDYSFSRITSPGRNLNLNSSGKSSPPSRETKDMNDSSPKSPNRIFNPFPVPLSTRQNKEVGVKLGLYKK